MHFEFLTGRNTVLQHNIRCHTKHFGIALSSTLSLSVCVRKYMLNLIYTVKVVRPFLCKTDISDRKYEMKLELKLNDNKYKIAQLP